MHDQRINSTMMNRSNPLQRITRWAPPGLPSRYVSVRAISLVATLVVGLLILFTFLPRTPLMMLQNSPNSSYSFAVEKSSIVDVASLIQAIQNATSHALEARGKLEALNLNATAWDELWHQKNPCRSRDELEPLYALRRIAKYVEPNAKWKQVFQEYEKLHQVCTQNVGNDLSGYFLSKSNNSGCRFLVGGIPPKAGLGNKVLSMVSTLLYAILTQRVFLVPAESLVPGIMCEPFQGSSWLLDPERKFTPEYAPGMDKFWTKSAQFYAEVDNDRSGKRRRGASSSIFALSPNDIWCQPGARFFCETEQAYLAHIPWIYVNGCLYFLPKLFAMPSFRPVLEELFPDRMALTHILRSSMLPSDTVWRRIEQIYSLHYKNADRRVGIQVRYRHGEEMYNKLHTIVTERVLQCALENGLLPPSAAMSEAPSSSPHNRTQTRVLITSLYQGLHDFLSEMYVRNPPATVDVGISQITHGSEQHYGEEEDKQALTEIVSLSLSDHLFVTPLSTFGGLAQGYGALTPWFIDNRPDSEHSSCIRAQTADVCYQDPHEFSCPYEPELSGRRVFKKVPYLKDCLAVDAKHGIQLITAPQT